MAAYNHLEIEPKWQKRWNDENAFETPLLKKGDKKLYILDFFPYPSGAGLHVGHMLPYTATDVVARAARMQGKKVLHPMGWDAFGLPAENFAIKSGVHPALSTAKNILEFKRQFSQTGISYDWNKELNSSDPAYYRWTQWLFELLYERGLAYRKNGLVNWCPKDQTVLANEQVVGGKCDRCGTTVVQRELKQWYFKITDYADRLIDDLDTLDWPEQIKAMQRNWIGRSEGAEVDFPLVGHTEAITVFTTRIDTLFGGTFLIIAPEHPLVESLTTSGQKNDVASYLEAVTLKNDLERTDLAKDITGVFTGSYATNPATGEAIPVWIADFVLGHYGSGAVFADAHDERDFTLAKRMGIPLKATLLPSDGKDAEAIRSLECCFSGQGILFDSQQFDGLTSEEARPRIIEWLAEKGLARKKVTFRLRDWLVSRQRFWGAPIPIAYDKDGGEHLIPENQLPVELPDDAQFLPTGQSPLTLAIDWKRYTDPETGQEWQRETDTLDGFVCSSWYFLRFPTPGLSDKAFDSELVQEWLPVDMYVGGAEHAVMHLLYARFFTKVLFDAGLLSFSEPFATLKNQGMILGTDHNKMSKSKGNVINPDVVVAEYGADTLRAYEMFMGPFGTEKPWSTKGIVGVRRFLERIWGLSAKVNSETPSDAENRILHKLTKKVTGDIEGFRFNTAVASMMEALNSLSELETISKDGYIRLLILLNPFAPHITEELYSQQGEKGLCSLAEWPSYDENFLVEDEVVYPVQINGKLRSRLTVPADTSDEELMKLVMADAKVQEHLAGKEVAKQIIVPGRLVSLVVQ